MTLAQRLLANGLACLVVLAAVSADAQPGPRRGPGGPGGGFGFGGNFQDLLRIPDVQSELKVADDQLEKIREIGETAERQRRDIMRMWEGIRGKTEEERREVFTQIREKVDKSRVDQEEQIGKVLLPQQLRRLRQIQLQMRLRGGASNALMQGQLSEELAVTQEQKDKLEQVREQVDKELREQIEKLRQEAQDRILGVLTPEQRGKFKDLLGEPFEFRRGGERRNRGGDDASRRRPDSE